MKDAEDPPSVTQSVSQTVGFRQWFLLALLCMSQFIETFNASAVFIALPAAIDGLGSNISEGPWIISAYQLTFASFLLISGRCSDVFSPKYVFMLGCLIFGILSLASGFLSNSIAFLVLRSLTGIAAAMTIPSALNIIVRVFTSDSARATAIAVFGANAAIGNVLGLIIGALFVQFTTWRWVFWIGGVVAIPIAVLSMFVIPSEAASRKQEKVDAVGVATASAFLLLLTFAVTTGPSTGWDNARFIAPLIISVALGVCFFIWEYRLPSTEAALPPHMWKYPNFGVFTFTALLPFFWFSSQFYSFTSYWQDTFHWSAISAAVHFLPLGIVIIFAIPFASQLPGKVSPKWLMLSGDLLLIAATILLSFADRQSRYWSINFPAFIIGSLGGTLLFTSTNITIFKVTPIDAAGTVGAIYNSALQLGTALGIPVLAAMHNSLTTATEPFKGRASAFYFFTGLLALDVIVTLIAYKEIIGGPSEDVESAGATQRPEMSENRNGAETTA